MFKGSMVALVTPMDKDNNLDYETLVRLVDFHLQNKTDAIVVVGTTGEAALLTHEEQKHIIRFVAKEVAGKIPVIAGSGATATSTAIELTKMAMEAGADACLLMAPGYLKPTQEGLYLHYQAIAKAVAIPQILYNVPSRTICDILPETVARLADISNIIGIKEATGKIERVKEILSLCNGKMDIYSGDDLTARELILAGGKGVISVVANVAPALMHDMTLAALKGDAEQAALLDKKLEGLHHKLFVETNPIPVKWAAMEMGLIAAGIRLPLTPLSEKFHPEVRSAMQQAGITINGG